MTRIAQVLLVAAVGLFLAAPALAAKPHKPAATISLNESSPSYGDFVDFTVSANVEPTELRLACSQNGTTSYGGGIVHYQLVYTTETIGLYAPNWPSGGADCVADVLYLTPHRTPIIGETTFTVAP